MRNPSRSISKRSGFYGGAPEKDKNPKRQPDSRHLSAQQRHNSWGLRRGGPDSDERWPGRRGMNQPARDIRFDGPSQKAAAPRSAARRSRRKRVRPRARSAAWAPREARLLGSLAE